MSENTADLCVFEGNPDLYGLGIRLGIYFQVLATLLASHFLPNEISTAWDTNGIFLLAVFAAVARATIEGSIQYVEAFVMLQLMFVFLLAVAWTNSDPKWWLRGAAGIMGKREFRFLEKHLGSSKIGGSWRAGLATAIACYNVWFWFRFEVPASCNANIFLFALAPPQPAIEKVYRALAVIYLLWRGSRYLLEGVVLGTWSILMVSTAWKDRKAFPWKLPRTRKFQAWVMSCYYKWGRKSDKNASKTIARLQRHQDNLRKDIFWQWRFSRGRWLSRWWTSLSITSSVVMTIWFVLAAELTLAWNSVNNVYDLNSTGQLIPFIIGLLGLIRALHFVVMEILEASKNSRIKPEIKIKSSSAYWRYRLHDGSFAQFNAPNDIKRRWSLDADRISSGPPKNCKRISGAEDIDHLEPAIPYPTNMSTRSLLKRTLRRRDQVEDFFNRRVILSDMGEWRYPLRDGTLQVFPDNRCDKRWSFDAQNNYDGLLPSKSGLSHEKWAAKSEIYSRINIEENYPGRIELASLKSVKDPVYNLKDGRKIMFKTSFPYRINESSTQPRRFSFGDRDDVRPPTYITRDRNPLPGSFVHQTKTESVASESSSTSGSESFFNSGGRKRKFNRAGVKMILGMLIRCCASPFIFCFATYRLHEIKRRERANRRRRGSEDSSFSHRSASSALSDGQPARPRWQRILRRMWRLLQFLVCAPCCIPWLVHRQRARRKAENSREAWQRREAFEAAYVRRHHRHSQPYLESKFVRKWWAKEVKWRSSARGPSIVYMIARIFFSLLGHDWASRIREDEESKGRVEGERQV